jgi:hypothetical protein
MAPERIFVSVDETTGRSTLSFAPKEVGTPVQYQDDQQGLVAMREARSIAEEHPGCKVEGPHFHASKPGGSKPRMRRR